MGNREKEPKLLSSQLIEKLLDKGICFNLISQQEAMKFLEQNNNYFKLTSYRKNFPTAIVNEKKIYTNLDFRHLIELSQMDMILRYQLVKMCLDIEHSLKVSLMNAIEKDENEDGYTIVDTYINSLDDSKKLNLLNEIKRNINSIYYYQLLKKHNIDNLTENIIDFPVWAFMETISFGLFLDFYYFYSLKIDTRNRKIIHLLNNVKQVRNASAHNTCMLNNLYAQNDQTKYVPNQLITNFLGNAGVNKEMRDSKLSNTVLYQISTVFYVHNKFVKSNSIKVKRYQELFQIMTSNMVTVQTSFAKNDLILSSFEYLYKISIYLNDGV